jgi:hypothetical protein
MTIRTRKFFGTIALLVLVVVWSLLGMTIAQTPWLANSGLLQAIFYVVAGPRMGAAGDADRELDVATGPRRLNPIIPGRPDRGKHHPRQHHAHHAQRALPSVPGDPRQRVQIGVALGLDDPRDRRYRAGETCLLRHHEVLAAPGFLVAERISEMPDSAAQGVSVTALPIVVSRCASVPFRLDSAE